MRDYGKLADFDTAAEGAAAGLLALMMGISEECWCAGWMKGLEFALWRVVPGTKYGQGTITARQAALLTLLSEEAGGWWRYGDEAEFVPIEKWLSDVSSASGDTSRPAPG